MVISGGPGSGASSVNLSRSRKTGGGSLGRLQTMVEERREASWSFALGLYKNTVALIKRTDLRYTAFVEKGIGQYRWGLQIPYEEKRKRRFVLCIGLKPSLILLNRLSTKQPGQCSPSKVPPSILDLWYLYIAGDYSPFWQIVSPWRNFDLISVQTRPQVFNIRTSLVQASYSSSRILDIRRAQRSIIICHLWGTFTLYRRKNQWSPRSLLCLTENPRTKLLHSFVQPRDIYADHSLA